MFCNYNLKLSCMKCASGKTLSWHIRRLFLLALKQFCYRNHLSIKIFQSLKIGGHWKAKESEQNGKSTRILLYKHGHHQPFQQLFKFPNSLKSGHQNHHKFASQYGANNGYITSHEKQKRYIGILPGYPLNFGYIYLHDRWWDLLSRDI